MIGGRLLSAYVAMVQFVSMFRYHITRLQTKQTTSGPQVAITE